MTSNSKLTNALSVQLRVDISGQAKKPKANGVAFLKLALLSLVAFAALISLATAALVNDPSQFAPVTAVWNEIKPVLVLLLLFLLKQRS
jgi:hypothetical protein